MGVIRLAERRGLLSGDLSPVQNWALQVLMIWEEHRSMRRREDDRIDQARAALLLLNPHGLKPQTWFKSLYPEFFGPVATEVVEVEVQEEDIEGNSAGAWDFTQAKVAPEEIEEVLRSMGQTSRMTLEDADGLGDDEGWV